ncbi:glycoside hydrolase family 5 [Fibrella aestuarina BUZ 2]|uniref:Glycoside hydrolase family 5 n=1 Tax=Fibrella aestuarina BUZ 2 TaxID=1166018 RepID=I0K1X0_9BACT|nr:cellulase family glycosylhydrolase [Fibrella aestuarina]CCG98123.1 glycoside hydrolase family 5 [Fibrella aestuarina BUZ 2]
MHRRTFVRTTSVVAAGVGLAGSEALATATRPRNKLPRWKGVNLLDFFSPDPTAKGRTKTTEEHLTWLHDWGFDFVRLPMAYPYYLSFDRSRPIRPDEVYQINQKAVDEIDQLVSLAHKHKMHVSLNLHRAPGYCVNAGFQEPYNLWTDPAAQEAFLYHWNFWANRYKQTSDKRISFDLLNEPSLRADMNDQHSARSAVPGDRYRKLVVAAQEAIRRENRKHLIIADGNNTGQSVIPEIADLDVGQSCRGYHPGIISHYKAPWAMKDVNNLPKPKWPGQVGSQYLGRELLETFYKPWFDLVAQGVGVHCGECGAWNKTPHNVFLAWFSDVLGLLSEHDIGFALWEFIGDFGIINSRRDDVAYEDWHGYKLDRKLLTMLMNV